MVCLFKEQFKVMKFLMTVPTERSTTPVVKKQINLVDPFDPTGLPTC
jgi:hypothetical protein